MSNITDKSLIKAWDAMHEAWQMGNYVSARKIAVSLRPLTMPEWKKKWHEFDIMVIEGFGGSLVDDDEMDEMRGVVSQLTGERNKLERENQILSDENNELFNSNEKLQSEVEKMRFEMDSLQNELDRVNEKLEAASRADHQSAQDTIDIVSNLTLARKLNGHLFFLTKCMQSKLEKLGQSVTEFEREELEKFKYDNRVGRKKGNKKQGQQDDIYAPENFSAGDFGYYDNNGNGDALDYGDSLEDL